MFRHKPTPEDAPDKSETKPSVVEVAPDEIKIAKKPAVMSGQEDLRELMEKNLKWSQIIYEQNRKINHKLLWTALASWIRLLILVGSIVAAVVFLPPLLKGVWSQYSSLFNGLSAGMGVKNPLDNVMKLFNLDPAQLEQLKTLLK